MGRKRKKITHGTITGYCHYRCRCKKCTEAWRLYNRKRRRENGIKEKPPHKTAHGTVNEYNNYHCRCAKCRKAHTEYMREIRKKRMKTNPPCMWPGCTKAQSERGVCPYHGQAANRLVRRGVRTWEELELGGVTLTAKQKK